MKRSQFVATEDGDTLDLDAAKKIEAAAALGSFPAERETTEALLPGLASPAASPRRAVLRALGERPEPAAREALIAAIGSPKDARDANGQSGALQALLGRADVSAVGVVQALTERDDDLNIEAEHRAALQGLLAGDSDPAGAAAVTDELVKGLGNPSPASQARSVELLVSLEGRAVEPVMQALARPETRRQAAVVLGRLRDARAVPGLLDTLDDDALPVRVASAWALGEIRDPAAIEHLAALTGDAAYEVRAAASTAINKFGNVAVLVHLTALLRPVLAGLGADASFGGRALPAPSSSRGPAPGGGGTARLAQVVRGVLGRNSG